MFPFAPSSSILYVPTYEDGKLPDFIVAEIVSLSLFQSSEPPDMSETESIGNQNYRSGELLGLYTGTLNYVRSYQNI